MERLIAKFLMNQRRAVKKIFEYDIDHIHDRNWNLPNLLLRYAHQNHAAPSHAPFPDAVYITHGINPIATLFLSPITPSYQA